MASALWTGIRPVKADGALHAEPGEIPTWRDMSERRRIHEGLVFTPEPFLSCGATWAVDGKDEWTLLADKPAPTVQYEHTMVVTRNGPLITALIAA